MMLGESFPNCLFCQLNDIGIKGSRQTTICGHNDQKDIVHFLTMLEEWMQ